MIVKSFETKKINLNEQKIILLHGKNEGHKNVTIATITKNTKDISKYEEKEILENADQFIENLSNGSLFDKEKFIIINRASDKILKIVEEIEEKILNETTIIINSNFLEKKSKLRNFFEKSKRNVCIAFYPDNQRSMSEIANNYLKNKSISLSRENLNIIIEKSNGDREKLFSDVDKLYYFSKNGKKLNDRIIGKLININENHDASILIDNFLAKNKYKMIRILNENNFTYEDSLVITRILLMKSKKIYSLSNNFQKNKNIELTLSNAKPPIFWKDKEITKQQIYKWSPKKIKELIYKLNQLELLIKKNLNNSINLITDFLLEQAS